jgi:DDE superfamily endonuclease
MVMECICSDGSVIDAVVIFRGTNLNTEWLVSKEYTSDWQFSASRRGWTSDVHALEWLRHGFEPATQEKGNGRYRISILDGHGSHVTLPFINHCRQYKIILLHLIPHTSHLCQPLDVGLFRPLKGALLLRLACSSKLKFRKFRNQNGLKLLLVPKGMLSQPKMSFSGWRGAGLLPFDPEQVLQHIQVPPPLAEPTIVFVPSFASPTDNSTLDPALFNSSLLTSSPLNAEAFLKTASALRNVVQEKKILASPICQLIPLACHHD